jgi:hypothetical protein
MSTVRIHVRTDKLGRKYHEDRCKCDWPGCQKVEKRLENMSVEALKPWQKHTTASPYDGFETEPPLMLPPGWSYMVYLAKVHNPKELINPVSFRPPDSHTKSYSQIFLELCPEHAMVTWDFINQGQEPEKFIRQRQLMEWLDAKAKGG